MWKRCPLGEASAPDAVAAWLAGQPETEALKEELRSCVADKFAALGIQAWSLALEASPKSWQRVHLHVYVSLESGGPCSRARLRTLWRQLPFRGKLALDVQGITCGKGPGARARAIHQAHYYVQAPKIGRVSGASSYPRGESFQVKAAWPLALWRSGKLDAQTVKEEILRTREACPKWCTEICRTLTLEREELDKKEGAEFHAAIPLVAFIPPFPEELEWLAQYKHVGVPQPPQLRIQKAAGEASPPVLRRYKTRGVCRGESRMGKSRRAQEWFGLGETFVINVQAVATPSLRPIREQKYQCVCYEEGNWEFVCKNQVLFQAAPGTVMMGQAQSNDRAYSVSVHAVAMIVTCNEFFVCCPTAARRWIEGNACLVHVRAPLFVPGGGDGEASAPAAPPG